LSGRANEIAACDLIAAWRALLARCCGFAQRVTLGDVLRLKERQGGFPALYDAIARGELHLTGLLMLGPHLTPENHLEVLGRAKHRTKKELSKLLRTLDPLPDLPARIEPLGPAPARSGIMRPSWADFVESLCPVVRELAPGDAPRDWVGDLRDFGVDGTESTQSVSGCQHAAGPANAALARPEPLGSALARPEPSSPALARSEPFGSALARSETSAPALARPEMTPVTGPLRYGVQFSAQEEYVQLVERAKALLSHTHSKSSLEEIHLRAMRLLVADLESKPSSKTTSARCARSSIASLPRDCFRAAETGPPFEWKYAC